MSSIIKVDQIQLSNGNTPTAGDLGINDTDTVIGFSKNVTSTSYSGSSGTEAYTGVSATYTPKASNSKILVTLTLSCGTTGNHANYALKWKMLRGTTSGSTFLTQSRFGFYPGPGNSAHQELFGTTQMTVVDEPNTTSTVTYGLWIENISGSPGWSINNNTGRTTWTFTEIAG